MKVTKHPSGEYEIIEVPNRLKEKVGAGAGIPASVLDRAEAEIESLADDYLSVAQLDLITLRDSLRAAERDPEASASYLERMYGAAHDMKGQGGSFGYPLVTRIADALCRYLGHPPDPDTVDLAVCAIHVDALHVIIQNDIPGDGGKLGREVLAGIERVVAKSAARNVASPD
jgi:hypothetical protein